MGQFTQTHIPIFVQEPFKGRTPGEGEVEITAMNIAGSFFFRDNEDKQRVMRYLRDEALTDIRTHYAAAEALAMGNPEMSLPAEEFWLPFDFFGMLSRLMRHYVFGPQFRVKAVPGGPNELHVERIFKQNNTVRLMNQSAEALTTMGDIVLRVDVEDVEDEATNEVRPQALFKAIKPHHFFPELDRLDATRVLSVTLAWVFPLNEAEAGEAGVAERHVVLREIHEVVEGEGQVNYELNAWSTEGLGKSLNVSKFFPELEGGPTGIDEIPLVHVGYDVSAGNFWGESQFLRVERLVIAIENRMSQEDEVLEKHARPKLIVGPGVLDPEGRSRLADFDVIEIEPSILEKAVKPEYLTWDMQLGAISHELEKLEEYLFITTETSPASFGLERDGSQVESARALRFKAHRTVNKVNDMRVDFDGGVRDLFRIAQKLENAALVEDGGTAYERGPVELFWPDPIIEDNEAEVNSYVARKSVGLVSRKRAVKDLDNLNEVQAEREVTEILQDNVDEATADTVRIDPDPAFPEAPSSEPLAAAADLTGEEPEDQPDGEGFDEGDAITGSNVLNGAQVASILSLVEGVSSGKIEKASAVELMGVAFGIETSVAERIIGDPKAVEQVVATPAVAPVPKTDEEPAAEV